MSLNLVMDPNGPTVVAIIINANGTKALFGKGPDEIKCLGEKMIKV